MKLRHSVFAVFMGVAVVTPVSAWADCYLTAVDTTCAKEANYFSARIFSSYGLCSPLPNGEDDLFTLNDVISNGLSCDLGERIVTVSSNVSAEDFEEHSCQNGRDELYLSIDGVQTFNFGTLFELCGQNKGKHSDRIIEVEHGEVKQCIISYDDYSDEFKMPKNLTERSVQCQRIDTRSNEHIRIDKVQIERKIP